MILATQTGSSPLTSWSASINRWIGAFTSEQRAAVISRQRMFCWSEEDSQQLCSAVIALIAAHPARK
jgi:hypothetical protein